MADYPEYENLLITSIAPHVLSVQLNRPKKLNALGLQFWIDIRNFFEAAESDGNTRVIILSGAGRMFTAGLDLQAAATLTSTNEETARAALEIRRTGKAWQQAFSNIETCGKAVIACAHNAVIGAGVEMLSACDIRFCTEDAVFRAAEVDIGLAADVGGLQRFPKLIGNQSLVRELVMSGRAMGSEEAFRHGFVSRVLADKDKMMESALELANQIASKSPIAMLGIKELLNYSRDHNVEDSLSYAITWNMAMLQGSDVKKAAAGMIMKQSPEFENLPKVNRSKM